MTVDAVLRRATSDLAAAGVQSPATDAELLAAHVLSVSRPEVVRRRVMSSEFAPAGVEIFEQLVARRVQRVPVQHLTGRADFRRLSLDVGPGVFVPRPETEVTAGLALRALVSMASVVSTKPLRLVDLCTGSGAIALSVVTEADAQGIDVVAVAVELSGDAVVWALRNAERLGLGRVDVRHGAVAGSCADLDGTVDVVTANPPYIPDDAVPREPEVRDHDPAMALFGGADGLVVVREVAVAAARLCRPGGAVIVEHGESQGSQVAEVLIAAGFASVETHLDLTGRPRATVGSLSAGHPSPAVAVQDFRA